MNSATSGLALVAAFLVACADHAHPGDAMRDDVTNDVPATTDDGVDGALPNDGSFDTARTEDASGDVEDVVDSSDGHGDAMTPDGSTTPECVLPRDCAVSVCHIAACVAGHCVVEADSAADGTLCDDGDLCTSGDRCVAGTCTSTARLTCPVCTRDVPGTYLVSFPAVSTRQPHALAMQPDDSAAIVGFADGDFWFARVPANGLGATEQRYGHARMGDSGYALTTLRDGGLLLAGYSQVDGGPSLPWVVRTDALGGSISTQAYFADRGGSFLGVVEESDGGFVLLGNVGGRAALTRVAADGSVVWSHDYFTLYTAYETSTLVELADGGFAFAGEERLGMFGTPHVIRTDSAGAVVWDHTFTRSTSDHLLSILALTDGTLVVGGNSMAGPAGSAWLMQLDASGNEVWSRYYGTDLNASVTNIARANDGGFVLASREHDDAWLIRTDAQGQQTDRATLALGGDEEANAIAIANDGSIVVAGSSHRATGLPYDGWVARFRDLASIGCGTD